ncbi:RnfH family protein [Congregibacter sp.]|uniref:RnfH family protein n=1 Tax=Congregibacter sp. TaxID=2744308 RepID=UPI003F6B6311
MNDSSDVAVEVVYALPDRQSILKLSVPEGTTAIEAARQSGIEEQFDALTLGEDTRLGIFGHLVAQTQVLRAGDRVEIYRPLLADPKEVRKERAARAKARRETQSAD